MARIRTIKPEFWTNETLSALPEATHLLAAALLNYADDEGYFNGNPALVKAACSPLREPSVSIHDSLASLSNVGFIEFFTAADGRKYGHVVKFAEHQRVNRATPSKIKRLLVLTEPSVSPQLQLSESSPLEGNREQGTGKGKDQGEGSAPLRDADTLPRGLDQAAWSLWTDYCRRRGHPITDDQLAGAMAHAISFGSEQASVVNQAIAGGWKNLLPLKRVNTSAADPVAEKAWDDLLRNEGPGTDTRCQRALLAIGGWMRVRMRTTAEAGVMRRQFLKAYAEAA